MSRNQDWIAADCGPDGTRIWAMRGSSAIDPGVMAPTAGSAAEVAAAIAAAVPDRLDPGHPTPVIVNGLADAPLAPVPATPLAAPLAPLPATDPRLTLFLAPSLRQTAPPDLMGGDAIRIAGFQALNPGWDGIICLAGAQTRWAQVSAGEVVSFQSFVSAELALPLTGAPVPGPDRWDREAFATALGDSMARPERLAAQIAGSRAAATLGALDPAQAEARIWGALIGAELAATRPYWLGQQLALIGTQAATRPYAEALEIQGTPVVIADADRATLAGLTAAWRDGVKTG